jgi:large subunit ribosomal protein L7/L12
MLRTGVYRLWKASECASLEINGLSQAALRCLPLLDATLGTSGHARSFSAAAGEEEERVITNPKVLDLAEQITQLNLLEVSDLTEILRKRLNIQAPAGGMGFGFPAGGMPVAAAPAAGTHDP